MGTEQWRRAHRAARERWQEGLDRAHGQRLAQQRTQQLAEETPEQGRERVERDRQERAGWRAQSAQLRSGRATGDSPTEISSDSPAG